MATNTQPQDTDEDDSLSRDTANTREAIGFFNKNKTILDDDYWFENVRFPEKAVEHRMEELEDWQDEEHFDEDERSRRARKDLEEDLPYWTIYFHPNREFHEDVDAALQAGLTPFYYKDTFYLALGGCGMDLSPKLDAYQALTSGSVPRDSKLFTDEDYFRYVVGDDVTEKVKEKVRQ